MTSRLSSCVDVDIRDKVMVITIDRPEARNAIDLATAEALQRAMRRLDADQRVAAGVLTGSGGTFCAGMDLKAFLKGERPTLDGSGFAGFVETPPNKPLIAAVEGFALGGGFEIALACDLIVAARSATFGLPEVKRGLVAGAGGLMRLPRKVPQPLAMELALTGRRLTAEEAHAVHLVSRLVDDGQAVDRAVQLAQEIAENAPLAVQASKRILADSRLWTDDEEFELQRQISRPLSTTSDAREGATAFAEKRRPVWTST